MEEFSTKLIRDGQMYKLSYTLDKRQQKISIKNENEISLLGARRVQEEVDELINAKFPSKMLWNMKKLNDDAAKTYSCNKILRYNSLSIELALRIVYPNEYEKYKENEKKKLFIDTPLEILNVGCTSVGKTLFILRNVLSDEAFATFSKALTSIKETTACSIVYHINSGDISLAANKVLIIVTLKTRDEVYADISTLMLETFEEYIQAIQNSSEQSDDTQKIRELAINSIKRRLVLNRDKTFGLGERDIIDDLSYKIEDLLNNIVIQYYANSKSIEKVAELDKDYLIKQILEQMKLDKKEHILNEIMVVAEKKKYEEPFTEINSYIYDVLCSDINKFNELYETEAEVDRDVKIFTDGAGEKTTLLLSHIFGNKKIQRKQDYFTIEPFVKCANIYVENDNFNFLERELIMSDSVGINQGQKNAANMKEVALNRIRASLTDRNPSIVLYHSKINTKDDYVVDVANELNLEGYGPNTHIIYGNLDLIVRERAEVDGYEIEEFPEEEFLDFMQEVNDAYIDVDSITLSSIIGNRIYVCDKSSKLSKKLSYTKEYMGTSILKRILDEYTDENLEELPINEIEFMNFIKDNSICNKVYAKFIESVPKFIPINYSSMRWNTLQKALETLYYNEWGFDVLCPALVVRKIIASEFGKEEIQKEFEQIFSDKSNEIKKRFLLKVTEAAQIVLVTEYKSFFLRLLRMRYDFSFRTDFSTSMTNDRKINLQRLYKSCLEKEGLSGENNLEVVFNIAWNRTINQIKEEINQ